MTPAETLRLVGEVIGIAIVLGGGLWWITKLLWRIYNQGQHLREEVLTTNVKLDALNGSVARHSSQLGVHENKIAFLEGKEVARAELAAAAVAAAEIVKDAAETARQMVKDAEEKPQ